MATLNSINSAILSALLASAPICGLVANAPITPSGYVEKSATKTEAGKINLNLFECIDEDAHANHKIMAIIEDSQTIVLENGSKWHVSKVDVVKGWDHSHHLYITNNHALLSSHKFALVNKELGLAVPSSMVTPPTPSSSKVLYVKEIDKERNIIQLNNGAEFAVNSSDTSTLNKLNLNAQVLVGINSHDEDRDYPYLILDASLGSHSYVRAALISK